MRQFTNEALDLTLYHTLCCDILCACISMWEECYSI